MIPAPPPFKRLRGADGSVVYGTEMELEESGPNSPLEVPGGGDEVNLVPEIEGDSLEDSRPRLTSQVGIFSEDTTLNVMANAETGVLMSLNEGALQYLLAGARANVGIKSGRYMFEVTIIEGVLQAETTTFQHKGAFPRNVLRVGLSLANGDLLLGETENSFCFDNEGSFIHNRSTSSSVGHKFGPDETITLVVNQQSEGPNPFTVSLFSNGQRLANPQAIPEHLRGKPLFPTVTYRGATVHISFGPTPAVPLPFKCRMLQEAAADDVVVKGRTASKNGKYEVLLPVLVPDEGSFDWLDGFLAEHPEFEELSDRKILDWALRSGLVRGDASPSKGSKDKPEMNFGHPHLDEGQVKSTLLSAAVLQERSLVLMEVKSNLLKRDRLHVLKLLQHSHLRRVAKVLAGAPPESFKKHLHESLLKEKQQKLNAEHEVQKRERHKKRLHELHQRQIEWTRRKAERDRQREDAAMRKLEAAALSGTMEVLIESVEENEEEMEPEPKLEPEPELPVPKAELTAEELALSFRKPGPVGDLTASALVKDLGSFSFPTEDEGFDAVDFEWQPRAVAETHLRSWILEKKVTTCVEDLEPSEWFREKLQVWHKDLQDWLTKLNEFKDPIRRAALLASKAAAQEAAGDASKVDGQKDAEGPPAEDGKQQPVELDKEELDVFSVQDVCGLNGGEPLFAHYTFEDWALLNLRFELHLLSHAFRHDCQDPERPGISPDNLPFYYNHYYKKPLNIRNFGIDHVDQLLAMVRDTVVVCSRVLESQVTDDLESNEIFVKLTEESRRERQRRIDAGDSSAQLHCLNRHEGLSLATLTGQGRLNARQLLTPTGVPTMVLPVGVTTITLPPIVAPRPRTPLPPPPPRLGGTGTRQAPLPVVPPPPPPSRGAATTTAPPAMYGTTPKPPPPPAARAGPYS